MNDPREKELWGIFREAREDTIYRKKKIRYSDLEEQVGLILQALPEHEQDIIWEFICLSDDMNLRIIEMLYSREDGR